MLSVRHGASCFAKRVAQTRMSDAFRTSPSAVLTTRGFAQQRWGAQSSLTKPRDVVTSPLSSFTSSLFDALPTQNHQLQQSRTKVSKAQKKQSAKDKRRAKIFLSKKKNHGPTKDGADEESKKTELEPFMQHQEWVKFQQSLAVDGFETGQIKTERARRTGNRGGKRMRMIRERELAALPEVPQIGKTSAMRLSPELTEELLKEAYSYIPKREGKRGTNNLRRQARRWKLVREIHAKRKAGNIASHERRMEQRHQRRQRVIAVKDSIPDVRRGDLNYQAFVLKHWAGGLTRDLSVGDSTSERLVSHASGDS